MLMLTCPCGRPVDPEYNEKGIRVLIAALGEEKILKTQDGAWKVPTIHILVHGVVGRELPYSSFEKVE